MTVKKTLKYSFVICAFVLGLSTAAHAGPLPTPIPSVPKPKAAPEVDPTLVVSGLALLGGTLAALHMRRRK